ncbi:MULTISPECIES: HAD family hydrolase [unclassified Staphylococcus]|uniref:HAD family hydrolase n=1 Tax=unclassified Staphylococcus TaxID=91994 RepID=UPI0021CEC37E|nr:MULTISPECIES: HAD family hydrolase [unclassified Staphylococcus]UXR71858.1 HAD family hydrolase [Staphylococcus sp. IVB6240]UXR76555.1 HAD family hydrolase [Staphylococcus sp. IVB6233]UXR80683.1 HAD family hydrolase [Staphylococcus sp. IVB6218]
MAIKWLLFDKDGTLIQFDQSWVKVGIQLVDDVCEHFEIAERSIVYDAIGIEEQAFRSGSVMASGSLEEMTAIFNQYTHVDTYDWVCARSQQLIDTREPESKLYPGVREALIQLKSHGYQLAIVTGDNAQGVSHFLNETGMEDVFSCVISTNGDNYEKPDPRLLQPLWSLGVEGEEMIMIGDTDLDMETGKRARCAKNIGVKTGLGREATFDEADVVLEDVTQLIDYLEGWNNIVLKDVKQSEKEK